MNKKTIAVVAASVIAVSVAGTYFVSQRQHGTELQPAHPASAEALFRASFADLDGKPQALAQWRGKVMVVNFWATWCPPCRAEMPEFVSLQGKFRENGVIFVGIALDEKGKVQAFADEIGVNYPLLLGELEAVSLTRSLGNRLGGLPFTVIIDRSGRIVSTEMGELSKARLESLIKSLL